MSDDRKESIDDDSVERRHEKRTAVNQFSSVEFSMKGLEYVYQFKIWNISEKGLCILVKNNSAILSHLQVGDSYTLKFYTLEKKAHPQNLEAIVRHITPNDKGKYQGHYWVGLKIKPSSNSINSFIAPSR